MRMVSQLLLDHGVEKDRSSHGMLPSPPPVQVQRAHLTLNASREVPSTVGAHDGAVEALMSDLDHELLKVSRIKTYQEGNGLILNRDCASYREKEAEISMNFTISLNLTLQKSLTLAPI